MKGRSLAIGFALLVALTAMAQAQAPNITMAVTSKKSAGVSTSRALTVDRNEAFHFKFVATPGSVCEMKVWSGKAANDPAKRLVSSSGVTATQEYDVSPGDTDFPASGLSTIIEARCKGPNGAEAVQTATISSR